MLFRYCEYSPGIDSWNEAAYGNGFFVAPAFVADNDWVCMPMAGNEPPRYKLPDVKFGLRRPIHVHTRDTGTVSLHQLLADLGMQPEP